jgi:uncharacterized protein YeaO (DUF488 family)
MPFDAFSYSRRAALCASPEQGDSRVPTPLASVRLLTESICPLESPGANYKNARLFACPLPALTPSGQRTTLPSGNPCRTRSQMTKVKRAYGPAEPSDGRRFLVDRLWPRGVTKARLQIEAWLKDLAPSNELRKWFNHDPAKWDAFQRRYFTELAAKPEGLQTLQQAARRGTVTLLYGAHDTEHNNAAALRAYLTRRSERQPGTSRSGKAAARSRPRR